MKCPECGHHVGDHDAVCPYCSKALYEDTTLMKNITGRKKIDRESFINEKKEEGKSKQGFFGRAKKLFSGKNLKIVLICAAAVVVIAVAVIIVISVNSSKGEKTAKKAAEYVGLEISQAQDKLGIKFEGESAFSGVNNAIEFDGVYEAQEKVKVEGVTYPEWAIFVKLSQDNRIETVKYANFSLLGGGLKGKEKKEVVSLGRFKKGASWSDINEEIDMDYYSVEYGKDKTGYVYRYWYTSDNGDVQQVILTVNFDTDNKYIDYSTQFVYPTYL